MRLFSFNSSLYIPVLEFEKHCFRKSLGVSNSVSLRLGPWRQQLPITVSTAREAAIAQASACAAAAWTHLQLLRGVFQAIQDFIRSGQGASEVDAHGHLLQACQVTEKKACAFISTNCESKTTKNIYFCQPAQPDVHRLQL